MSVISFSFKPTRRTAVLLLVALLLVAVVAYERREEAASNASPSPSKKQSEYRRPFEAAADHYYQMLLAKRFVELDQALAAAQRDRATLSDGQPLAAAIYGGVSGCLNSGCRDTLTRSDWQRRNALLEEWKAAVPDSAFAELAAADYHAEYAWVIRGRDWANTVSDEAWAGFRGEMDTAEQQLRALSPRAKEDPQWSTAMLEVGVGRHWPRMQFEALYNTASAKDPYYFPIQFAACTYEAPRWYGSLDDLHRCVDRAVEATQARLGETMYARINWTLHTEDMFGDGQADWSRMRSGFERIIADFPDRWNINKFGYFACLAHDAPTLVKLQKLIGSEPIAYAWDGSEELYRHCVDVALHVANGAEADDQ